LEVDGGISAVVGFNFSEDVEELGSDSLVRVVKWEDGGAGYFELPVEGLNLNLTMTTAPRMKEGSDLIEVFFDGLFDMPEGAAESFREAYTGDITKYPPRIEHSNSE
jgi:hypothetical protein